MTYLYDVPFDRSQLPTLIGLARECFPPFVGNSAQELFDWSQESYDLPSVRREWWERLATNGLIPADWADGSRRPFLCLHCMEGSQENVEFPLSPCPCSEAGCQLDRGYCTGFCPDRFRNALAISLDPRRVLAAEGIVQQALPGARILWRMRPRHILQTELAYPSLYLTFSEHQKLALWDLGYGIHTARYELGDSRIRPQTQGTVILNAPNFAGEKLWEPT